MMFACKDAMRVKVFHNDDKTFSYQASSTEDSVQPSGDIRGGDCKVLYKCETDVFLLPPEEEPPAGAKRLCTITNEYTALNPEGKWKVLVDPAALPAGLSVPPGEVCAS